MDGPRSVKALLVVAVAALALSYVVRIIDAGFLLWAVLLMASSWASAAGVVVAVISRRRRGL